MKSIGVINKYKLQLKFYLSLLVLQRFGEEKNKPGYLQGVCWSELNPREKLFDFDTYGWGGVQERAMGKKNTVSISELFLLFNTLKGTKECFYHGVDNRGYSLWS